MALSHLLNSNAKMLAAIANAYGASPAVDANVHSEAYLVGAWHDAVIGSGNPYRTKPVPVMIAEIRNDIVGGASKTAYSASVPVLLADIASNVRGSTISSLLKGYSELLSIVTEGGGVPERPFTLPSQTGFDLLYYAPDYPTKAFSTGQTATVGGPFTLSGTEALNVEETAYTIRGASSWGSDVAYIFADMASAPGEIVCYFKTGTSIGALPTLASTSDGTGTLPFWHLRLDGATTKFFPEWATTNGGFSQANLAYTTQDIFSTLATSTWYVYRIQIRNSYTARLTIETTGGSVIGNCYVFGGNVPRIHGLKVFYELFGKSAADIVYGFLGAKSVGNTDYSAWATTGFVAGASMLAAPGAGWGGSLFNGITGAGSVTHDNTNKEWDIVAQGYGAGAAYDIGSVTNGDVVEVYGKLNAMTSVMGSMEVALGFAYGVNSNEVQISSTGLFHATLTCNGTQASTQVLLGGRSGETNATFSVQDLLILKNKIALGTSTSNPA